MRVCRTWPWDCVGVVLQSKTQPAFVAGRKQSVARCVSRAAMRTRCFRFHWKSLGDVYCAIPRNETWRAVGSLRLFGSKKACCSPKVCSTVAPAASCGVATHWPTALELQQWSSCTRKACCTAAAKQAWQHSGLLHCGSTKQHKGLLLFCSKMA